MLEVGKPVPDFTLPNQDGKEIKLSDLRGQKVIIFAFPRANTSGCTTQACGFRDHMPQYKNVNAVVFGLSDDPQKALSDWKKQENLPYDLLSDTNHEVLEKLGAWGEKNMYGKVSTGTIRSHWVIDENGNLLDQKIKVSPTDSVELATATVGGQ